MIALFRYNHFCNPFRAHDVFMIERSKRSIHAKNIQLSRIRLLGNGEAEQYEHPSNAAPNVVEEDLGPPDAPSDSGVPVKEVTMHNQSGVWVEQTNWLLCRRTLLLLIRPITSPIPLG